MFNKRKIFLSNFRIEMKTLQLDNKIYKAWKYEKYCPRVKNVLIEIDVWKYKECTKNIKKLMVFLSNLI